MEFCWRLFFNALTMQFIILPFLSIFFHLIVVSNNEPRSVYPRSNFITGITFDMSTVKNECPGNGLSAPRSDNWTITWAEDGHQYTSWGDGGGFGGDNWDGRVSMGVARVEGDKDNYSGYNVWGGKEPESSQETFKGKSYGIISIEGILYMWRSGDGVSGQCFGRQSIYKSEDHGQYWLETEAAWDFSTEENDGFFVPTFLQFGQDYQGSRDKYVYIYAPEHTESVTKNPDKDGNARWDVNNPGKINLIRVPKKLINNKSSYSFFSGFNKKGRPLWSKKVEDRQPVFEDNKNGVMRTSVIYNPGLKRYILTVQQVGRYKDLEGRKGYMGIYEAPEPWGPWATVLFKHPWDIGESPHLMNDEYPGDAKTVYWNFSPKWWSNDGRDFVMVYTGPGGDQWGTVEGSFIVGK